MNKLQIKNILIAGADRLGDTVFRTPLFRLFKEIFPNATLDVLAPTKLSAEVLKNNPYIQTLYVLPEITPDIFLKNYYDLVINTSDSVAAKNAIQNIPGKHIQHIASSERKHAVETLLEFFAEKFNHDITQFEKHYDLYPQESNFEKTKTLLKENGVDLKVQRLIGLHLGCHGLSKERSRLFNPFAHPKAWPLKKYIKLVKKLKKHDPNIQIILTGTRAEEKIGASFCKKCPDTINLISQLNVLDVAALMHSLALFITNDTGPLHLASASDVSILALFGKTDPAKTGPYPLTSNRIVLHKPKIRDISVKEVFNTTCNLIYNA